MARKNNLIGRRFKKLKVIKEVEPVYTKGRSKKYRWLCECECGNTKIVRENDLISRRTKSCGCLRTEINSIVHRKHGMSETRLDNILYGMKQRCYNKNSRRYTDYGGRGITVCKEWLGENGLNNFSEWALSHGYAENLTIDRIDNDKGYSPDNCRWITNKEQANNKRNTKKYKYKGEIHTISEWAEITGIGYYMLKARILNYGYTIEEAIETPKYTRISKIKNKDD